MVRTIAVSIPKGGVGKTTTTINLGAALAELGHRVLLVDLDPQSHLARGLGVPVGPETIYTAITHYRTRFEVAIEGAIYPTQAGVDLIPSSARLNLANDELATTIEREKVLQKLLAPLARRYDFILIDTLPYLGVLVTNALVAAQEVLIPVEAEYLATESVELILEQVSLMQRSGLNPRLTILGMLLTQVDNRTNLSREVVEHVRTVFGKQVPVFATMIKRSVRFPESQLEHQTIFQYEPNGEGARSYRALAQEVVHAEA